MICIPIKKIDLKGNYTAIVACSVARNDAGLKTSLMPS